MEQLKPIALPPSQVDSARDSQWWTDHLQAMAYLWGRMDMGEKRDVNDNYRFTMAYADAYHEWRHNQRVMMWALYRALEIWDERRSEFGLGWL